MRTKFTVKQATKQNRVKSLSRGVIFMMKVVSEPARSEISRAFERPGFFKKMARAWNNFELRFALQFCERQPVQLQDLYVS